MIGGVAGFPEPDLERAWRRLDAAHGEAILLRRAQKSARGGLARRIAQRLGLVGMPRRAAVLAADLADVEVEIVLLRREYDLAAARRLRAA